MEESSRNGYLSSCTNYADFKLRLKDGSNRNLLRQLVPTTRLGLDYLHLVANGVAFAKHHAQIYSLKYSPGHDAFGSDGNLFGDPERFGADRQMPRNTVEMYPLPVALPVVD